MPMATETKYWTLEEVHSLPDDGNKYELVYGELFVTPAPTNEHETISARLTRILDPYVAAQALGFVYHPRAVFRIGREVEVEPDLMVRQPHPEARGSWETAPLPLLVVEILSDSSRRRDLERKRRLYIDAGIPEYWIVDGSNQTITVVRRGAKANTTSGELTWAPAGASEPLTFDVARIF